MSQLNVDEVSASQVILEDTAAATQQCSGDMLAFSQPMPQHNIAGFSNDVDAFAFSQPDGDFFSIAGAMMSQRKSDKNILPSARLTRFYSRESPDVIIQHLSSILDDFLVSHNVQDASVYLYFPFDSCVDKLPYSRQEKVPDNGKDSRTNSTARFRTCKFPKE